MAKDTEKETFEGDPLGWRPKDFSDPVPDKVMDARFALLSDEDAEKLKADFDSGRDPVFRYLWLGGDMFGSLGANSSATMTRCAYVGVDVETTLRLFKASAYGPQTDEKFIPEMLCEAMDFVGEFREEMSKLHYGSALRTKSRRPIRKNGDGNYR